MESHLNPQSPLSRMQEPVIRRATVTDAQAVAEIGARTFSETFAHLYPPEDLAGFLAEAYSLEQTRADLADPAKAVWLVEADGVVVGYALAGPCGLPHAEVTPACGELKRFYLLKSSQNGGTGRRLFDEIMAWLERDGPRDLWIGVWSENFGAQRFYARQGFSKVGEYGFKVGSTVDHEFILKRVAQRDSTIA
ncbi:MAG: GNAT family N-acetyltransferase [Phenylobacterium sp.]|uniref:GNAT family N-acetyltransferase n=1 Tax=Phenylobacterium sp. TaxID=1871053 RepID=UPI002724CA48|nr:GNAT family N-acetyltransferase [Phenylobacterium sp.]MDO9432098.1 GNAT family N-acetyltransferase [Phenylobacterium sp.]